ncbi:MAG TPA: hypothetical protein VM925_04505 [Labilithrix sp.]|nr:hypothetical protein [Labilithrix sp.]
MPVTALASANDEARDAWLETMLGSGAGAAMVTARERRAAVDDLVVPDRQGDRAVSS